MATSLCDDLIEVRQSKFGKGLFPSQIISAYSVICKISGEQVSFEETLQMGEKESHAVQIDINKYIVCEPPFLYSNHSCEPNCAINEHLEMYTLQDVTRDIELVWDYSTSMLERHWTLNCECGSKLCRTLITDFDLLSIELQEKYLHKKQVFPFITKQLSSIRFSNCKCA